MQFSMTRSLSAGAAISCAPAAGGRRGARGRVSVRPLNAATKEKAPKVSSADEDEDLGPYGNGYKPYPLPFGKERVYVWERPPAGVTADKIFKPRAVPTNHFEQCAAPPPSRLDATPALRSVVSRRHALGLVASGMT